MANLLVSEIFGSIQGESSWAGYPCTFVRLAGCNLACTYCDTEYARAGGTPVEADAVVREVDALALPTVEVTGGEPLLQAATVELLQRLCHGGYRVLLETNGSVPLEPVPSPVHIVMDLKTPGSGMVRDMRWQNLEVLKSTDDLKIVLTGRSDYEWALAKLREWELPARVRVSFSPCAGRLEPSRLAAWMLEDRLDVRLQLQLHRILWPDRDRGV